MNKDKRTLMYRLTKQNSILPQVIGFMSVLIIIIALGVIAGINISFANNANNITYDTPVSNCQHNFQSKLKYNFFLQYYETEYICLNCGVKR